MNENTSKRIVRFHPEVEERFRKVTSRLDGLVEENKKLTSNLKIAKGEREALERQEIYVDDMPGKQLPFRYQINIPLIGGSSSPVTGTFNVSKDGPFICRRIYISVLVTDAPFLEFPSTTSDFRHFIGRYVPVTSRSTYAEEIISQINPAITRIIGWAYPEPPVPGVFGVPSIVAPPLDFEWEYNDSGGEVTRQEKPISGDVVYRQDDDGYVMNNEVFSAGTTVNFIVSPTRPVTIVRQYSSRDQITLTGPIDIDLRVTFDGFKILQPRGTWR